MGRLLIRQVLLLTLRLDIGWHFNGLDAVPVTNAKRAHFRAFANERVFAHHDVLHDENFRSPFSDFGLNFDGLAVRGWLHETGVDFEQWRADDAGSFH